MSTKNMTDAEFDAYMEEKEYERLYDPDECDSDEDDGQGDDVWADSDTFASAGWGTDEDYGCYESDPYDCW